MPPPLQDSNRLFHAILRHQYTPSASVIILAGVRSGWTGSLSLSRTMAGEGSTGSCAGQQQMQHLQLQSISYILVLTQPS